MPTMMCASTVCVCAHAAAGNVISLVCCCYQLHHCCYNAAAAHEQHKQCRPCPHLSSIESRTLAWDWVCTLQTSFLAVWVRAGWAAAWDLLCCRLGRPCAQQRCHWTSPLQQQLPGVKQTPGWCVQALLCSVRIIKQRVDQHKRLAHAALWIPQFSAPVPTFTTSSRRWHILAYTYLLLRTCTLQSTAQCRHATQYSRVL